MNGPLFGSVFALIFLAELGDKTQLAVLSQSATASSRWTVFFAASLALTASTAIGVLFGEGLRRLVPDERCIKGAAAALFFVFGALLLREALGPRRAAAAEAPARMGAVGRFVLARAAELERAAFEDYRALAARATQPGLRRLLEDLAVDEETHFKALGALQTAHAAELLETPGAPADGELRHDVAHADRDVVAHALDHELATAAFYDELARVARIPALKQALGALAAAERGHAERLREFV